MGGLGHRLWNTLACVLIGGVAGNALAQTLVPSPTPSPSSSPQAVLRPVPTLYQGLSDPVLQRLLTELAASLKARVDAGLSPAGGADDPEACQYELAPVQFRYPRLGGAKPTPGSGVAKTLFSCEVTDGFKMDVLGSTRFLGGSSVEQPSDPILVGVGHSLGLSATALGERGSFSLDAETRLVERSRMDSDLGEGASDFSAAELNTLRCRFDAARTSDDSFFLRAEAGLREFSASGHKWGASGQSRLMTELLARSRLLGSSGSAEADAQGESGQGLSGLEETQMYCSITAGTSVIMLDGHCVGRVGAELESNTEGWDATVARLESSLRLSTNPLGRSSKARGFLDAGVSGSGYADGAGTCSFLFGAGMEVELDRGCSIRFGAGLRRSLYTEDSPGNDGAEEFMRSSLWGDPREDAMMFLEGSFSF